jgi:uncharacterized RDD family membrane protein YckC
VSTPNPYAPPKSAVRDAAEAAAEPADRLIRLVAAILDGLILGCMVYVPIVVAIAGAGGFAGPGESAEPNEVALGLGVLLAVIGGVAWIWLTVTFVARNGQSIAKKIMGIKVVRRDGSRATLGRIFWLRNVVNGLLSVIPLYDLVDVLFIFGEERQCLHDKIADTIVVRA